MGSIGQPSAGHCKDRCAGQHDNHAVSDSTVAARFEQMLAAPDKKAAAIKLGWVDERGSYQDLRDAVGPGNLEAHHGPQSQNALERREVVNMIMELMVLCTMPLAVKKVPRYEAGGSRTRVLSAADDVGHRTASPGSGSSMAVVQRSQSLSCMDLLGGLHAPRPPPKTEQPTVQSQKNCLPFLLMLPEQ